MNYNQALNACIDDLMTFSPTDLATLANYLGIPPRDEQKLCERLAQRIMTRHRAAQMPGDPSAADKALLDATQEPNLEKVQAILAAGEANPGVQDKYGMTPLMYAISKGDLAMVNAILATGKANVALVRATSREGATALMMSIRHGIDMVNTILATGKVNPGEQYDDGKTVLMYAIEEEGGDPEVVNALLATGKANPGAQTTQRRWSALMLAVQAQNLEIVRALLASGDAIPGARTDWGATALILAAQKPNLEIVTALLASKESEPGAKDKYERTALMYAVPEKHPDIVKAILASGEANPGAADKFGMTALMTTARLGLSLEIVNALLKTGEANPGAQDDGGFTALMYAVEDGNSDTIKALLATGKARPSVRNKKGETALTIARSIRDNAIRAGHPQRAEIVEQYDEIERMLILAGLQDIPKKKLPQPKEAPLWMHLCARLETANIKTLQRLAQDLDIDTTDTAGKPKHRRRLCYDLAQNYEQLLKIEGEAPAEEYEHIGIQCKNDTTLGGEEWPEIAPEDLFVDKYNYCFSFDDIEGILATNGRHPLSRIPLAEVQLKDGTSLLAAFEARKKTKHVDIEEKQLKKMRQVHTLITNPTQAIKNRLAEMLDEHPGGPEQRNYFEVVTLDGWEKKTRKEYQQFLSSLRNEELVQDNKPVLDVLAKLSTPSFSELLEGLIQSIKAMPKENKQTYRILLKVMLEEE